ncbi:hypothetical protein ABIA06_003237 [Bradyrhizobium yuanmingense]
MAICRLTERATKWGFAAGYHIPDAHSPTPGSFSAPSSSSPGAQPIFFRGPVIPLFEYQTAELRGANVDGMCAGLAAEWLFNLPSSPRSRMSALQPGSQAHASAAMRRQRYEELRNQLQNPAEEFQPKDMCCRKQACNHPRDGDDTNLAGPRISPGSWMKSPKTHLSICSACASPMDTHAWSQRPPRMERPLSSIQPWRIRGHIDRMSHVLVSLAKSFSDNNGHPVVTVVTQRMS